MAETVGLVHRLKILPGKFVGWVYIGPTPTNTTLLLVVQDSPGDPVDVTFKANMIDALSTALTSRRVVKAFHADTNATITQLDFDFA